MKKGADSFVRDKRGKKVLEGEKGGDERIRVFLKQCKLVGTVLVNQSDRGQSRIKKTWFNPKMTAGPQTFEVSSVNG